jgi:hypothetical protein
LIKVLSICRSDIAYSKFLDGATHSASIYCRSDIAVSQTSGGHNCQFVIATISQQYFNDIANNNTYREPADLTHGATDRSISCCHSDPWLTLRVFSFADKPQEILAD